MNIRACNVTASLISIFLLFAAGCVSEKASTANVNPQGIGESLKGRRVFPADNPWNQDISHFPVDPLSNLIIASIGTDKSLHPDFGTVYKGQPSGIPYIVVSGRQQKVPVTFGEGKSESDPGPYPIPPHAPIEGGPNGDGDRHVLVIDQEDWKLYELYEAYSKENGRRWEAGSGAIFDLKANSLRPAGWTSADAAGLPIFPGLVRYDEVVEQKEITHALRFTVRTTRRGYVSPATHFASQKTDNTLPPMGMRVRLRADYDISNFPEVSQRILTALKRYGMFLADNGGDWFLSGAPNPKWDDHAINTLKRVKGRDFEVIQMGEVVTARPKE
jgi:hypothetical protein